MYSYKENVSCAEFTDYNNAIGANPERFKCTSFTYGKGFIIYIISPKFSKTFSRKHFLTKFVKKMKPLF